jgi:DNA repair exonuclease SbcCD ATPase subunit
MKINRVVIYNYGPFFGDHVFSFSRKGLVLVCGRNLDDPRCDSNGSGKSSLFDSLDWGLFGRVPRGDHADSVVNEESRSCQVRVELTDDAGQPVVIERSRGKETNLRFWVGTEDLQALDVKETQARIERVLGVDRDTFHAAVYFGQNDLIRYADSTDGERMQTLTRILQFEEIDLFLETTKTMLAGLKESEVERTSRLDYQQGELDGLKSQDFSAQLRVWEERRTLEVNSWTMDYQAREAERARQEQHLREHMPAAKAELERLRKEIDGALVPPRVLPAFRDQLTEAQKAHEVTRYRLQHAQEKLNKHKPLGEVCNQCGQPVPESLRQAARQSLEQDVLAMQEAYKNATALVQAAQAAFNAEETKVAIAGAEAAQRHLQVLRHFETAQTRYTLLGGQWLAVEQEQRNLEQLWKAIQARAGESNPFAAQVYQVAQRIQELEQSMATVRAELEQITERRRFLEFWKEGFGPSGLKSYILDARLHELTQAANRWVRLLTGGVFWVQFQAQRLTRGKKLVNAPEVRVSRWNPDGTITERNYRSLSGGEKQRISFPIDFGLSHLISSRAKQRYDLLILDEVFRHLDRSGKTAMVEMLEQLAKEKGAVYVSEHDAEMQGLFDQRIIIEKKNRRSAIREESYGTAQKSQPASAQAPHGIPAGALVESPRREPVRRTPVAR